MSASPTDRFRRIDTSFDAAVDVPSAERTAFIERECDGDEELRAEVLELVRAYHSSDSPLELPAARIAAPLLEAAAAMAGPIPDHIGPFRVVREIGRGGMGRVFLGERADGQFEQRVAIKLIQHGAPGVLRRFVEERRILALLEHPGIARLVDGGITDGGLPYFAMELVDGEPIDRYCDARGLTLDERLALFASVCDAVAYAHHHLIIHRDLKPSNILVTADGKVKLLDFGIAKLLGARQTGDDVTHTEVSVMTPEFAAPEQVCGTPVSTATDVYSLGVLLYLLVTGERPYDVRGKSPADVQRVVCDDVPPRPSSRAPAAVRRRLRGDLDLIVMTALQKEKERRYQSPAALAGDLQRFRSGRAILARPDSARYRLAKFVGRHRGGVATATLLVLALAAAASRERVLRGRAEQEARKAKEVEEFLVRVFDVADPYASREPDGGSVTARELLDRGVRRIDSTLAAQPEVQAELRTVLGRVYTNLGLFDRAAPLLQRSLEQHMALRGSLDPHVTANMDLLGVALVRQDRYDEAEPLLRRALEQRRRLLGDRDSATAESIEHLAMLLEQRSRYDAAEPLYREALAIRQSLFGDSSVQVASSLDRLGLLLHRKAAYEEAESLHRRAVAIDLRRLGENHLSTAEAMQNLAMTLQLRRNLREAEHYFRRSLAAKRKVLGDAHPSVTVGLNNLGVLLVRDRSRLDEAEALTREALALDRQIFGERHSYVAEGLRNLGIILRTKGEFAEAERLLRQALEMDRALFGERHRAVATMTYHLAQVRHLVGDSDGAVRLLREALTTYRQLLGGGHVNTVAAMGVLARVLTESGDPREGEALARESLSHLDPAKGQHRWYFIAAQRTLGEAVLVQGRADEALPLLERALAMSSEEFGNDDLRTADAQLAYGSALVAKRRYADAAPLLRAARATLVKNRRAQPRLAARAAAAVERLPPTSSR